MSLLSPPSSHRLFLLQHSFQQLFLFAVVQLQNFNYIFYTCAANLHTKLRFIHKAAWVNCGSLLLLSSIWCWTVSACLFCILVIRDWKCSRLAIRRANSKWENISLAFYYSGEYTMSHCDIFTLHTWADRVGHIFMQMSFVEVCLKHSHFSPYIPPGHYPGADPVDSDTGKLTLRTRE